MVVNLLGTAERGRAPRGSEREVEAIGSDVRL